MLTDSKTGQVFKLDEHQKTALSWLHEKPRAALFLGMSLQKTITTLLYLRDMIYNEALIFKVLVIAPDKVARVTWPDEVQKWEEVKNIRYSIVEGDAKQRAKALEKPAEVFFMGVANMVWLVEHFGGVLPFDCLVIDELSLFKSSKSERFKKLRKSLKRSNVPYRVGLTGTPSPNGMVDLWSEMMLIDDGARLGGTFGAFIDKYFRTRGNGMIVYEYIPRKGSDKIISKKLSDIALSMQTRDFKELPPLHEVEHLLEFDEIDKATYKELEDEYVIDYLGDEITVKTGADLLNKLLQLTSGAIYKEKEEDKKREYIILNSLKLNEIKKIFEENPGENFLIVYQFQHEAERILEAFPWVQLLPRGAKLKEVFNAWNRGEIKGLLIHPASAGHGLNLQHGGSRIIWTSPTWNLEHWLQTLARLLRTGATRPIYVHRLLVKGTVDMKIKKRVNSKDTNQKFILNTIKAYHEQSK